jgi:hypothetical protein
MPRAMAPPSTVPCPLLQNMGVVPRTCYNCYYAGHFARDYTKMRLNFAHRLHSHFNCPPRGPTKVIAARTDRVNYTTVEDVPKDEYILMGTFSLNRHPIIILFDSGASRDFMSKACIQKCQLVIEHMSTSYMILTPGGNVITR